MEDAEFEIKCYWKSELTHLYFLDMTEPKSAVRKLMRWIKSVKG